jgi:YfiH family protein
LHSTLLNRHGFRHAFATRSGGVSAAPYDTLNLGFHLGDDDEAVRENRARFVISRLDIAETIAELEGDALIARNEGLGAAARTADCVPILIAHPSSGHVGAVHTGWRGAVAGIVPRAIEGLAHDSAELVVAIGPHIRVGAFEIGEDVARALEHAANGRTVVQRDGAKPHGDLAALIRLQLRDAGVPDDAIDDVGGCTHSDAAHFFSHRRDHGRTGRHLSVIVARAPR